MDSLGKMHRFAGHAILGALAVNATALAQQLPAATLQLLFPAGAEIIETTDLTALAAKPRVMVLWMLNPQRNLDVRNREGGSCSDIRTGDFGQYRKAPTRLSLLDSERTKIINTVEIREGALGFRSADDTFKLPVCMLDLNRERSILYLRDLTGEGRQSSVHTPDL